MTETLQQLTTGLVVPIGAMVGVTLLGLLGALLGCAVTASILLMLKEVVVPAQEEW